ncbi:MAG: ATP-binding protein [Oscillospiraceae bacterium]|nr:ATP-binding protein [Oscillospiraceae bacterium]
MKLLRIQAQGLPLFKNGVDLVFYAQQRVAEDDKDTLSPLTPASRFYLNNTNAVIGINASGKTSVLKLILLVLDLVNNEPISHGETRDILGESNKSVLTVNFISDSGDLCQLESVITVTNRHGELQYRIIQETLWVKSFSSIKSKKQLTEFDGLTPYAVRNGGEDFLPDDTSIIIAYNKKVRQHVKVASLLSMTNFNVLPFSESIPAAVIQYLDPTIEALYFEREDQKLTIHLKFYGKKEILLSDPTELNRYLSSGTVKGIVTFTLAIQMLKEGGYLIVDELEDHFNKEIAATLLRFFMDSSVNKNGGVLIFSTHYPEILDEFNRNDSIFVTRNRDGITVSNLNDILKRNDLKKSDAYQSGILEGTVPAYEAYMKLKKNIQASLEKEG